MAKLWPIYHKNGVRFGAGTWGIEVFDAEGMVLCMDVAPSGDISLQLGRVSKRCQNIRCFDVHGLERDALFSASIWQFFVCIPC